MSCQRGAWRRTEALQLGLREGWGRVIPLSFLLQRELHPALVLLAPFLLMVNQTATSVLGLSRTNGAGPSFKVTGVSVSQSAQLSLVSSPTNHQSLIQHGLVFPEQISGTRWTELLSPHPLPTLFLSFRLKGWDRGRTWVPLGHGSAALPFSM